MDNKNYNNNHYSLILIKIQNKIWRESLQWDPFEHHSGIGKKIIKFKYIQELQMDLEARKEEK